MAITIGGEPLLRGETITQARRRLGLTSGATTRTATTRSGDAGGTIRSLLRQYGLTELTSMVDRWVRQDLTWPEIEAQLYDPSTKAGKVVDRMYPELRLRQETGKAPLTIGQIRELRDTYTGILRAAGMPETFYDDPNDFTRWIMEDVDPAEFEERVGIAVDWAQNQPAEVRQQLKALYGVDEGGIAAYALDPEKGLPALQRRGAAAAISGAASRTQFGALTREEAERLASLGVDYGAARQGFGILERSEELLNPLAGEAGGVTFDRGRQLAAVFEGDVDAQEAFERQTGNRVGAFRGGGGVATNREGFAGLGASSD